MAKKSRATGKRERKHSRDALQRSIEKQSPAKKQSLALRSPKAASPERIDGAEEFPIVALGASAGGLDAFTTFLKALPVDTGMAFVLIQHMDPTHESMLASLLQRHTKMLIREAADQTPVVANHIYIVPPNSLMTISNGVLSLTARGPRSFRDYPIDQFFVSLAEDRRNRAIGVVLSGTATDGTRGLLAIKAEGGITFAQDRESAQFSSMPASAVASGCVDFTLPPDRIAQELARLNSHSYIRRTASPETLDLPDADDMRKILRQLRITTGVDFELYKPAMISRRIARRMALQKLSTHEQYLELLRKDRAELLALYDDIFIHVTGFFRDPESLAALQRRVLSTFLPSKDSRSVRIWVPGCSSGEEVYSIAILLFEQLGDRRSNVTIQIFGTDITESSAQKAREGLYPLASMADVSQERQRRFFSRADGSFQISKTIRDICVFARHDLTKDPPFSRIDLISCRNVLIYMGSALQKRVIEAFHYALKPNGHLLLGKSESLSAYSSFFSTDDAKHKILTRRSLESPLQFHAGLVERGVEKERPAVSLRPPETNMRREAERILLDKFAPAAIVIDSGLQIVHFQGNTGPFLAPASGEPSFHLLKMIRPELLADMRSAIYNAKKQGEAIHKEGIRLKNGGNSSTVDVHVSPIPTRNANVSDYLVVFRESPELAHKTEPQESTGAVRNPTRAALAVKGREIEALREQLRDLVQDHDAGDEEVRSMNEEILSSNEELQSTNEELETAKEELESTNEELTTLNDELQKRNSELSVITDDMSNVLHGVDIPIVILDANLRIRRFTPAAGRVLNVISSDMGRPLSDIAPTLQSLHWKDLFSGVVEQGQSIEKEVQDGEGRWYSLRVRPYRSGPDRPGGILIALFDVDTVKRSMEVAAKARQHVEDLEARLAFAGDGLRIGLWEYDIASDEIRGNEQWNALYGLVGNKPGSREEWAARVHSDDRNLFCEDLDHIITTGEVSSSEYRVVWPDGSTHWLNRRSQLVRDARNNPVRIRGVSIDISAQKLLGQERQAFAARIASAQESERRRIARELHDGLIQDLAAMAMDLGRRVTEPPAPPAQLKVDFKAFQVRVVKAAEAARHVAYELHPTELDDFGLEKALSAYCQQFARDNGIRVNFRSRKVPRNLKREIASSLYKVAQEGLRNVVKHSHAKTAQVTLDTPGECVRLRLEDKGQGFNLSSLQSASGLGVASMRERVQLANGKFSIQSEPGKGTQVLAEVPLGEREEEP